MSYHYGVPSAHYTKFYDSAYSYSSGEYIKYESKYDEIPPRRYSRRPIPQEYVEYKPTYTYESTSTKRHSRKPIPKEHLGYNYSPTTSQQSYQTYTHPTPYASRARTNTTLPKPQPNREPRQATEKDAARAGIPAGYSLKNWDPTEQPILLLGSVFNANSLSKWIHDWTLHKKGFRQQAKKPIKKSKNNAIQQIDRRLLPVIVDGKPVDALHDTMSSQNVVTEAYAKDIGLVVNRDPKTQEHFTNAIGEVSHFVGETTAHVAFPDDPTRTWECAFAVIKDCTVPLVMGNPFLTVTETLTKFQHRLKKVIAPLSKFWRLMLMNESQQKLRCYFDDGLPLYATVDTGADVDLVSSAYVQSRGWKVSALPEDSGFVILSNQRIMKVDGYVEKMFMVGGEVMRKRFYVLNGLACDLILGDQTIEELDLFNEHKTSFVDMEDSSSMADFLMIQWIERIDEMDSWADEQLAECSQAHSTPGAANGTVQANAQSNTWSRLSSKLGFKPTTTSPRNKNDMQIALRRKLEALDQIERARKKLAATKMATMQGSPLQDELSRDEERRLKYMQVRQKLVQLMGDLRT